MIGFIILVVLFVFMALGHVLYFKRGYFKKYYHDILKWHIPDNNLHRFDGCSFHNICKHCGKEIMQDSQGNWF